MSYETIGLKTSADRYLFTGENRASQILENLGKATVASVGGFCLGGMLELALCCDFRLAADNARFGLPEVKPGVLPGGGGTQRLPRLIGMTKAKELVFLGDFIDAAEAYRVGWSIGSYPRTNEKRKPSFVGR